MKYKGIFWDIDNTLHDASKPWDVSSEVERKLLTGEIQLTSLSREQLSCFVPYEELSELMNEIPKKTQGIISNGNHKVQIDKLKLLRLYDFINPELIFTSYGEIEEILKNTNHHLYPKSFNNKSKEEVFLELRKYTGKPSTYMFERALEKSGLKSKDCVMVGDSWNDIEGAQEVGMDNIYISDIDKEPLYNLNGIKIIPNHKVQKEDIKGLRKLLID